MCPNPLLFPKVDILCLQPSLHHVTHVYHTADPIPMGVCTGVSSSCALGGYALESRYVASAFILFPSGSILRTSNDRCHLGNVLKYDTVSKLGWAVDVRTHGIGVIVEKLLAEDWEEEDEGGGDKEANQGRNVPRMTDEGDCVVSWTSVASTPSDLPDRFPSA